MDHSMHDHSMHDHSMQDHSMHEMGHDMAHEMPASAVPSAQPASGHLHHGLGDMNTMMSMSFHFGYNEVVLFDGWSFNTIGGLIGSMIGIFILAALYEGLKYFREYLLWKTYHALQYRSVDIPPPKTNNENHKVVHSIEEVIHKQPLKPSMLSVSHAVQTFLHIVQITLSYFLMLIFMTYNVWLCIALVLGAAVGYFLFGWKKTIMHDVTEHCH